jgi:D-hydroxyproline dehydrogenase subunit beta
MDADVEVAVLARMLRRAANYLPTLPTLRAIRAWTGFRAASQDGFPMIGPAPDSARSVGIPSRTWVAAGHAGLGVTTSLAMAKLMAAQIAGTSAAILFEPYLPQRSVNARSDAGPYQSDTASDRR